MDTFHISHSLSGWLAAAISPIFSTVGVIAWDKSWKKSAFYLNFFKCSLASSIFLAISIPTKSFGSDSFSLKAISMISLSSLLGIVIGDYMWLTALRMIGSRRVITVDALKPFISEIFSVIILKEKLYWSMVIGMILSTLGVLVVALETETDDQQPSDINIESKAITFDQSLNMCANDIDNMEKDNSQSNNNYSTSAISRFNPFLRFIPNTVTSGYLLSMGNVIFDSYGAVVTKDYGQNMDDWEINTIRFGFASLVMAIYLIILFIIPFTLSALEIIQYYIISPNQSEKSSMTLSSKIFNLHNHRHHNGFTVGLPDHSTHDQMPITQIRDDVSIEMTELDKSTTSTSISIHHHDISSTSSSTFIPSISASSSKLDDSTSMSHMTWNDWLLSAFGVLSVTFLSSALSNYALFVVSVGIWVTLTSLGPLYSLPLVYIMKGEKITVRACIGACFAVAGVVVLCFRF